MGQCVIKDCGFNVPNLGDHNQKNLNEFLKDVLLFYRESSLFICFFKKIKRIKNRYSNKTNKEHTKSNRYEHSEEIISNTPQNHSDFEDYNSSIDEKKSQKKEINEGFNIIDINEIFLRE